VSVGPVENNIVINVESKSSGSVSIHLSVHEYEEEKKEAPERDINVNFILPRRVSSMQVVFEEESSSSSNSISAGSVEEEKKEPQALIPPIKGRVSSSQLLIEEGVYDMNLGALEIAEQMHKDEVLMINIKPKYFKFKQIKKPKPKRRVKFDLRDPNVHQLNLNFNMQHNLDDSNGSEPNLEGQRPK
jgi:hypothetical protein